MMEKVEDVQIIDSLVVDKDDFLSAYILSEESGTLDSYKDFFQTNEPVSSTVYKNQKGAESGNSAFSFSYRQENQIDGTYNIVDNPEKFTLEMD